MKKKSNVKKKAEKVSVIFQNNNPLKYKEPSCPIISWLIKEYKTEKALLDL